MLEALNKLEPTPLANLFLNGMDADQIWSQLELRAKNVCSLVDLVFEGEHPDPLAPEEDIPDEEEEESYAEDDEMELDEEDDTLMVNSEDEEDEEDQAESSGSEDLGEHVAPLKTARIQPEHLVRRGVDLDKPSPRQSGKEQHGRRNKNKHPSLDDDFFSIAEFNREIEGAEAKSSSRGRLDDDSGSENEGSVDLFADVNQQDGSDDMEEDDGHSCEFQNPIYPSSLVLPIGTAFVYNDFFDLPAGVSVPAQLNGKRKTKTSVEEAVDDLRQSKVRFHEEVRVKLIKSRRNPVSLLQLYDEADGDDDDDVDDEGLNAFARKWLQQYGEDDDDDISEEDEDEDEDEDDDEEDEENEEDEESEKDEESFAAIERTKDDLFADDDDDTLASGTLLFLS
jgi:U3 small nucleolar RNA-associated protein MPP10